MRIWLAANIPPSPAGGVHRVMSEWARRLAERGHHTRVMMGAARPRPVDALRFPLALAVRMLFAGARKPDWIIARSFDGVACALAVKILALNIRIALHNHGWEEHVYEVERRLPASDVSRRTTWKARMVRFPLLRLSLALCDCCLCGAMAEMRWIARRYPRWRSKLACVPNGVDLRLIGDWRTVAAYPPHFLIIGPPTWKKNSAYACAVFDSISDRIADARLFWIGSGSASLPAAARLIRRQDAVANIAHEEPQNMPRWYAACPYLISSSCFEGGRSLAILESMAQAVLVFASPIPSTAEIIRHGVNGFMLCQTNPEADARLIVSILADNALQTRIRRRAVGTALRHRWERQIVRLERALCR